MSKDILIAEIGKGKRWTQANFPRKIIASFFGISPSGGKGPAIKLRHITDSGSAKSEQTRPFVSVPSNNHRFELGAGRGLSYPVKDRPIGVFRRLGSGKYDYMLLMPNAPEYPSVSSYLSSQYTGSGHHLKRVEVDDSQLKKIWPSCPLLP